MNFSPVVWLPTHRATRFSASRSNSLAAGFARNERLSLSLFNDGSRSLAIRLFITVSFLLREAMVVIIRNLYVPCTEINRRNDAKQSSRECRWRNRSTRFVIIRCFLFPETQCGPQFREEKKRKKKRINSFSSVFSTFVLVTFRKYRNDENTKLTYIRRVSCISVRRKYRSGIERRCGDVT